MSKLKNSKDSPLPPISKELRKALLDIKYGGGDGLDIDDLEPSHCHDCTLPMGSTEKCSFDEGHPKEIEQDSEGWWFWDEVWVDRYGPYATKEKCQEELRRYIEEVLGPVS